jgi:hypothetical protein
VVSPITCFSMNHQNQLKQMTNRAMFATCGQDCVYVEKDDILWINSLANGFI